MHLLRKAQHIFYLNFCPIIEYCRSTHMSEYLVLIRHVKAADAMYAEPLPAISIPVSWASSWVTA